jgi:hypothetical protein
LEQEINLHIKGTAKPNETDYEMINNSRKSGRRKLSFENRNERNKRRKSKDLRKTVSFPELTHAAKMSLTSAGKMDAAKLFSEALEATPTRKIRIRKVRGAHTKNVLVLSISEEALSFFIEAYLTESKCLNFEVKQKKLRIYIDPCYHVIKAAKDECYMWRVWGRIEVCTGCWWEAWGKGTIGETKT